MIRRAYRWFDERLGTSSFARGALNKIFPDHWSFMLGEIALYCFVILVLTGTFLTFFYDGTSATTVYEGSYEPLRGREVSGAFASTVEISFDVRAGMVMRQIHHWTALLFVASIVLHLCRVFFTGAFRKPREINWVIGVTLLGLAIFNGFTGYSLPDDLLSGTGLRIAYSIALSVPLIGTWMAFLIFGGEFPAEDILGRLFVMHVLIIPAAIGVLLAIHLAIVWRQKHTQFPESGRRETNVVGSRLWPTYALKSAGLFFGIFALVALFGGLFQINPVWIYGPFEPHQVTTPAQPDWYLGWVEGAMRIFPPWEIRAWGFEIPNPFYPAVLLPGVTFALLYAWPFVEARLTGDHDAHHLLDRPRDRPLRTAVGAATLTFYVVLFAAASNDVVAKGLEVPVGALTWMFRVLAIAAPVVVGFGTHRYMRALAASGVERWTEVPVRALFRPMRSR